uniref:2-aminoethanethiol dioxygenase n=1 Tax=Corethrella appendiculata TaxID=1370023 RepID=U5EWC7_9DIPT
MSSLFARVFKQAKITFDIKNADMFKTNFNNLKQLVDQLTFSDVNLNPESVTRKSFQHIDAAPCKYIGIYEDELFTMSVFVLNENFKMPLHDHPAMFGILRVLAGKIQVQSYTRANSVDEVANESLPPNQKRTSQVYTKAEPVKYLDVSMNDCALLTPNERNFHEIMAVNGPAAFFDILSPPYNTNIQPDNVRRSCSFYKKILLSSTTDASSPANTGGQNYILERIPTPHYYYCDTEEYEKPEFMKIE